MGTIQINFDQLKKAHWSDQETKNAQLLVDFVQQLMNNHDFDQVLQKFGNPYYKQHNRGIPDGMESLIAYVKDFTKRFPDYTYDVKHIFADGDMIIFHSHITTRKKDRGNDNTGFNAIDTWKIKNDQIVEHWDALQPMNGFLRFFFWIIGGKIANSNGVY